MLLNKFKSVLEQEKQDIMLFIKNHQNEIDADGDETDEIQARIIARTNAQILAKKQDKLLKIEMAMKKIASGKFGECEGCGEEIGEKRLAFNPGFNTCISCQEHIELRKKRPQ